MQKEGTMDDLEDVISVWNNTLDRIYEIFQKKMEEQYPEGVLLLGSIIEEFLRVLIVSRLIFSTRHYFNLASKDINEIDDYADDLSLYHKIKTSFMLGLVDKATYKALENFRKKRNRWVHDFFLEKERPDPQKIFEIASIILNNLRKKLIYYLRKM
jgi:hypothetical protein